MQKSKKKLRIYAFISCLSLLVFFQVRILAFATENVYESVDYCQELNIIGVNDEMLIDNHIPENSISNYAEKCVKFEDTSFALFDSSKCLVEINRIDNVINSKRLNINEEHRYVSLEELMCSLETYIIPSNYKLVNQYMFDESTVSLRYEREIFEGAYDTFDSYSIYVDTDVNELMFLYKSSSSYIYDGSVVISKEDAQEIAANFLHEKTDNWLSLDNNIKLVTVRQNDFWETNKEAEVITLAYIISDGSYEVYIDAIEAIVVGGDLLKADHGGAIGTPDIAEASGSVSLAVDKFSRMGYNNVISQNTYYFSGAGSYMKEAFYTCCHGSPTQLISDLDNPMPYAVFNYTSVPSQNYKFVFLDACDTASLYWSSAFGISSGTTGKAFWGWAQAVPAGKAYSYCKLFWPLLNGNTSVWTAAVQAAALEGSGLAIWFMGDQTYNGYY